MNAQKNSAYTLALFSAALLLVGLILGAVQADESKLPETTPVPKKATTATGARPQQDKTSTARHWFQLVNITIPPDSTHRNRNDLYKPPQIYVILEKNGEVIDGQSSTKTGWSVDFAAKEANTWPIQLGTDDRYSIEIWDRHRLWWHVQILKITGLSGEDFQNVIYENGGALDDKARLVRITFKETKPPEGGK